MEDNDIHEDIESKKIIRRWSRLSETDTMQAQERRVLEKNLGVTSWQMYHAAARLLVEQIPPPQFRADEFFPIPIMQSWVPLSVRREIAGLIFAREMEDDDIWQAFLADDYDDLWSEFFSQKNGEENDDSNRE